MWKQGKGIDFTVIVGKYYVILKYYMDGWSDIDTVMEYMCLKLLQICSNCRGLNFINTYLILISHNSNRHRYQRKEHNVCHMLNAICSPFPSNWHHPRVLYKFLLLSFYIFLFSILWTLVCHGIVGVFGDFWFWFSASSFKSEIWFPEWFPNMKKRIGYEYFASV